MERTSKRVAIYARVSSAGQDKRDLSVPEQIRQIGEFCDGQGWIVVKVFKEAKTGSETVNRPDLQRMLKAACSPAHPFDLILTREQSRFGRGDEDSTLRRQLREHGVAIDNITAPSGDMYARLTPGGEFLERTTSAMDIYSRQMSTMQMIAGQKAKARKGGLPGAQATCYGYVQDWRRVNGGKPVRVPIIDKSKAKVVKEMFRRYIRGQSLLGITRWLNDSGIAAPRGKQWYESTVRKLLSNETLLGRLVHGAIKKVKHPITRTMVNRKNDGEVIRVDGVFPAIIDQATFDKVQAILGRNESTRPQGGHPGNTLRAIGKCAVCGWHLAHQRNTRNGRWYYMCGTVKTKRVAASNPDCVGILYAEYVDEVVALFLKRVLSMPIQEIRGQVARYNAAATDLTGLSATETLDIAIAEHEEMVKNLVSGVARVKASSALLRRLESTEGKLTELLRSRDEIATHTHTPTVDIQSVLDARAGIKDALRDGDTNQMRALLTAIVSEVRCDWSQRKSAVVNFNYLYEDHREPIQAKMTDREAREWSDVLVEMEKAGNFKRSTLDQALRDSGDREAPRSDYRVSIEVRGAPLTFVPKWSITNAERATEEVIRQIAEALK